MLKKQKYIYMETANLIHNWEEQSKSDLIRNYLKYKKENNTPLINAYMAAIICKYWGVITNYYRQPHNTKIHVEDCYDWLINAIMNVTNHPYWFEDPILKLEYVKTGEVRTRKNPIYGKPDAPDIALKKCITSMRLGFFQDANRDIRKLNYTADSLDNIIEDRRDYILPNSNAEKDFNNTYYNDILIKQFNDGEYNKFFILEAILNGDVFTISSETKSMEFNKKKLSKHLRHLDTNYCNIISKELNIDKISLIEESKKYVNYNTSKMYNMIDTTLDNLKYQLKSLLGV